MTRHGFLRLALPVLACILLGACAPAAPPPLVVRDVAVATPADPLTPCARRPAPAGPPGVPTTGDPQATFDRAANKIVLSAGGGITLAALSRVVDDPAALRELSGGEWLLGADLEIVAGASLRVGAPEVSWLKLRSGAGGFASVKVLGGGLDVSGTCVTSWDVEQGRVDTAYEDGRSYLLARDGAQMTIDRAELRFLGHSAAESYGLSWRTEGSGGRISHSIVSNLYFGLYSYEVGGLVVTDNEFSANVVYGIDPHTGSHDLRIERNVVYGNGKHGIILAEDCVDSVIRDNVVYGNGHHGIVMYLHSDRNVIEGNESFRNAAQGINVNESSSNVVRANRVYDNAESGIGIGQNSQGNVVLDNEVRANQQDGVRLVTEAIGTELRDNIIGENARYGVYVDSDGAYSMIDNTVFDNQVGLLLKGKAEPPTDSNVYFGNREIDVKQG